MVFPYYMWFFGKHVLVFHIALCLGMLIRYVRGIEVLDNTLTYWLYRLAYIMHHVFFLIGWLESSCNSNNIFRQCELDRSNIVVFTSAHEHIKNIVNLRWNSHTQTHVIIVGKHVCTHASRKVHLHASCMMKLWQILFMISHVQETPRRICVEHVKP